MENGLGDEVGWQFSVKSTESKEIQEIMVWFCRTSGYHKAIVSARCNIDLGVKMSLHIKLGASLGELCQGISVGWTLY